MPKRKEDIKLLSDSLPAPLFLHNLVKANLHITVILIVPAPRLVTAEKKQGEE